MKRTAPCGLAEVRREKWPCHGQSQQLLAAMPHLSRRDTAERDPADEDVLEAMVDMREDLLGAIDDTRGETSPPNLPASFSPPAGAERAPCRRKLPMVDDGRYCIPWPSDTEDGEDADDDDDKSVDSMMDMDRPLQVFVGRH